MGLAIADCHRHHRAVEDVAGEQLLRELIPQLLLDTRFSGPRPLDRVVAAGGKPGPRVLAGQNSAGAIVFEHRKRRNGDVFIVHED